MTPNGVIGKDGKLPWNIPEDLQRFKAFTMGGCVIMGRKTFDSLPSGGLPGRKTIVVSRSRCLGLLNLGVGVRESLTMAIEYARTLDYGEVWIAGGAKLYEEALPLADNIYMTLVTREAVGDTYWLPNLDSFTKTSETPREDYVFLTYRRF